MSSAEHEPGALWSRVHEAGAALRAMSVEERAAAIARAARHLRAPSAELLARLAASSGLSQPMTRWALETTFAVFDEAGLRALARDVNDASAVHASGVAVVLAGNVLTTAARPLLLPLLAGVPAVAKASSRDDALPHAIARALELADARVGAACAVVTFGHDDVERLDALLAPAEHVQVLGGDEAVAAVRARARADQHVIGRGHGLGLGLVTRAVAESVQAAEAFARDVAAYDQRGCLSPHAILVEGSDDAAQAFARQLYEALARLERAMPRGAVPADAAAEQLQWRGVAAARGVLHAGEAFAVSCEHGASLRPSPGYRNVSVCSLASLAALPERAAPFARHLKALGVAGLADPASPAGLGGLAGLAPYTCEAGAMQTPPLAAPLDGLHPLAGFAYVRAA